MSASPNSNPIYAYSALSQTPPEITTSARAIHANTTLLDESMLLSSAALNSERMDLPQAHTGASRYHMKAEE